MGFVERKSRSALPRPVFTLVKEKRGEPNVLESLVSRAILMPIGVRAILSDFDVIMFFRKDPPQTEGRRNADP